MQILMVSLLTPAFADNLLKGTVIGTTESVNYQNNAKTTTINTRENAFDGDLNTFFASYDRSYTWAGRVSIWENHM